MEDIYALLNIDKGVLQEFHLQAARAVDHQTELTIGRNIRTLKDIEERMLTDTAVKVSQRTIDEIIGKVIDNAEKNNGDMSIWSVHELRIVAYYLMKLQGCQEAYRFALSLLDANWRDMFFNGLSFYCLDTWNMIVPELRQLTCALLVKKLKDYNGNNRKYMEMKNHANLFDEAGPRRLSALLARKGQDLESAPMYFSNRPSTFGQSYYSNVIIHYFEAQRITDLGKVEHIIGLHKDDRTKKLLFADLVERVDNLGDELKRTQLCKFANRILGDITLMSTWAPFIGATESEAQRLKKAKELVNVWFNKRIIETFFDVCVQDRSRKEFWLNHVDCVSSFKIVGSAETRRLLLGDSRVNTLFQRHFIEASSRNSKTSALVFFIRNKMVVEFSDTGAVYAYNKDHSKVKLITKRRISNTADLKIPAMGNLVYTDDWGDTVCNEEGRLAHLGHWQDRLDCWLKNLITNSNTSSDSSAFTENDAFSEPKPFNPVWYKESTSPESNSRTDYVPEQSATLTTDFSVSEEDNTLQKGIVVYEKNVEWILSSKRVANDQCRVVCNKFGFYIHLLRSCQYVYICPLADGATPTGSIWIKRVDVHGWMQIVHFIAGTEINVGYIKEDAKQLLYKQNYSQKNFIMVKL